jgi:hypothetical protein
MGSVIRSGMSGIHSYPTRLWIKNKFDRRLGRAGTDMRPNYKGSIAGQRHPTERQCRRFEIEDWLKKGFRPQKNLSQLRREQRLGVGFDPCDDLIANERRRNPTGVQPPGCIGAHVVHGKRVGGPIPDDVVTAASGDCVAVVARHRIAEQLLAFGQAECVKLEDVTVRFARHARFVQHGAPRHVAGIDWLCLRQKLLAHGGADAVGADQHIAALAGAVLEYRSDAAGILFDPAQFLAKPVVLRRQRIAQRPIQP